MIVGLTGGIGSGKSTTATIFNFLGVPVYEADAAAKNLLQTDLKLQKQLVSLLGNDILLAGQIDKAKMATKIFNDENLLKAANSLIHPAVGVDFKNWYNSRQSAFVLKEAAILFESGSYKECDKVIVVSAPTEMRIERVMKRNNISREEVLARMGKQWSEERKLELANYVILNDGSKSLIKQVLSVNEDLKREANQRSG